MDNNQKEKQAIDGINEFFKNFKEKDIYTKVFLEVILEKLINKNEKKS
jgi:hypothetical protein